MSLVALSTWNLTRLKIELVSPTLGGRFLITGPPGQSSINFFFFYNEHEFFSYHQKQKINIRS